MQNVDINEVGLEFELPSYPERTASATRITATKRRTTYCCFICVYKYFFTPIHVKSTDTKRHVRKRHRRIGFVEDFLVFGWDGVGVGDDGSDLDLSPRDTALTYGHHITLDT